MTDLTRRNIIEQHLLGKSYAHIANEIGISRSAIYKDQDRHPHKWDTERILDELIERYQELFVMYTNGISIYDDVLNELRVQSILTRFRFHIARVSRELAQLYAKKAEITASLL